ncbi:mitochondrial nicotinamide adenine dinucleotide transporter SLC25A51-like [Petromyzon marinus]|uniref:Solute carrier family 25 member 51-like n=1 Tax=Petromyzon marinus TaxID=7757 RepID=A0AAJ7WZW4_PETMA|nr:solute carrier family 25 member 51-like [Petromyzon marinus]XP_032814867.1 solute carrier family 25 member 51-like [Petromyzon marinus]XP_032814868.1 solute carrier family 25 member 51-like [Petromyzon marinus]
MEDSVTPTNAKTSLWASLPLRSYQSGALAGSASVLVSTALTFPIFKASTRQQMALSLSARPVLAQLLSEGLKSLLLRGLLAPSLQRVLCRSIMYGNYEFVLGKLAHMGPRLTDRSRLACSLAALLSGTLEAVLTPLERVQTLLVNPQTRGQHAFRHSFSALSHLGTLGLRELYVGLTPVLLRNGPSFALYLYIKDSVTLLVPASVRGRSTFLEGAFMGGFSSLLTGLAFYPLNTVKVQMQARIERHHLGFLATARDVVWRQGTRRLYRGVTAHCLGSIISWAVFEGSYRVIMEMM